MSVHGNNGNLDNSKLDRIKFEILQLEDENSKTKDYTHGDMVEKIKNIIKDAVNNKF